MAKKIDLSKDLFHGLERGVLEVEVPEGASAIDYLGGYETGINMRGYAITRRLVDVSNKRVYHLHFEKDGTILEVQK